MDHPLSFLGHQRRTYRDSRNRRSRLRTSHRSVIPRHPLFDGVHKWTLPSTQGLPWSLACSSDQPVTTPSSNIGYRHVSLWVCASPGHTPSERTNHGFSPSTILGPYQDRCRDHDPIIRSPARCWTDIYLEVPLGNLPFLTPTLPSPS